MKSSTLRLGVYLALLMSGSARAGTMTLSASDDTMVNSRFPNNNFGTGISMFTGTDSGAGGPGIGQMRSLIRFAMPAALQNKVTITHVALNIRLYAVGSSPTTVGSGVVAATILIQPISTAWAEGTAALSATGNGSGTFSGAPVVGVACGSGATWNQAACNIANWTTAGIDVSSTSGSASTAGKTSGTTLVWDSASNGNMISAVQGWINAPATNFGWRLLSSTEGTTAQQLQRFATRQSGNPPSLQIDYTTCTAAANLACVTSQSNNFCNDPGGASSTYTCTCTHRDANNNLAYTGTGTTSCTDLNDCAGSPCTTNGDSGATCTDAVAPSGGHSCTCTSGFVFNGTTCVAGCNNASPTPQPCGNGGTCNTTDGGNTWTCSGCNPGYVSNGASRAACVDFNACDATAKASCNDTQTGNSCQDDAAPALTYHCVCTNPAYVVGTVGGKSACVDKNECAGNPCVTGGDTGATCTDAAAPSTGYACNCDTGFVSDGTSCVSKCPGAADPCGNGGTCSSTAAGMWTCSCPTGYASSGGSHPTCVAVVCGDGIVSGSEQCDEPGANGTPGSCCSASCTFKPSTAECASAADCLQASMCTGSSSECPAPANAADGTACSSGSGTCVAGACVPSDMAAPGAGGDMASASGSGGCGCVVGGARSASEDPFAVLFALALVLVVRRRRRS